jgi:tripartite-type tricarboxylate transporter receptor subunit TctC
MQSIFQEIIMLTKRLALLATAAAAVCAAVPAVAQDFPVANKPITFVVPFAAGGPTDKAARDLALSMGKTLNTSIVIENAAGASGSIGANKVAKANPDGYTLLFFHIGQATLPTMLRNIPYKVESDFEYLGLVSENPMAVLARPSIPANNMAELVKWVNDNKGKINIGNAGIGSASHLCGMLFQSALKVDMTPVPYRGTAPAMTDLIGGQIDLMCDQSTVAAPQLEGKKVKGYAVTSPKRLAPAAFKDMPSMQEAGFKDFAVTIWQGLYAPKGTPAPVLKKLNDALKIAVKDPDFIAKQEAGGALVISDSRIDAAGHKAFVAAEIAKWGPVIKAAGVYAD